MGNTLEQQLIELFTSHVKGAACCPATRVNSECVEIAFRAWGKAKLIRIPVKAVLDDFVYAKKRVFEAIDQLSRQGSVDHCYLAHVTV